MKISYLTKCPKCGANIDENLSRFCQYCGQSLLAEEPEDDYDKEKLYTLEDRTLPFKQISNAEKANTYVKNGRSFFIAGLISWPLFSMIPILIAFTESIDITTLIFVGIFEAVLLPLTGWPLVVGIILFIKNGAAKRKAESIIKHPDVIYHGAIRGHSKRVVNPKTHAVLTTLNIRVEEPTKALFFMDIADDRTHFKYPLDEKVVLYKRDEEFVIRKETVK